MANDPIFTDLLARDLGSVEKPKALPAGSYYATVKDYALGKSKEKQTPFVKFNFNNLSAGPDINPEDVASIDLSKKNLNRDFYLTEDSLFRIKDFFTSLGLSTSGKGIGELLPQAVGAAVILDVSQRNSPDGKDIFADVRDCKGRP